MQHHYAVTLEQPQHFLRNHKSSFIHQVVSPQQRQQCRSVFSYCRDLFRSNLEDKNANPILVFLTQQQQAVQLFDNPIISITTTDHENKNIEEEVSVGPVIAT